MISDFWLSFTFFLGLFRLPLPLLPFFDVLSFSYILFYLALFNFKKHSNISIGLLCPGSNSVGGISTWASHFHSSLNSESCSVVPIYLDYLPFSREPNILLRISKGIVNSIFAFLLSLKWFLLTPNCHKVLHICTSGSLGFTRDILFSLVYKSLGCKIILHFHYGQFPNFYSLLPLPIRILLRHFLGLADLLIPIDTPTYDYLDSLSIGRQLLLLPNPSPTINKKDLVHITSERPYFLFVGRISLSKGIHELLVAWNQFTTSHSSQFDLFLVGPICSDALPLLSQYKSDSLHVVGSQSHQLSLSYINSCYALILPSYFEGCPYVVLEAMSLAKCVIATNVGCVPHLLSESSGILIPTHDSDSLFSAMRSLSSSEDLLSDISRNAYQRYLSQFTCHIVFSRYLNFIINKLWISYTFLSWHIFLFFVTLHPFYKLFASYSLLLILI